MIRPEILRVTAGPTDGSLGDRLVAAKRLTTARLDALRLEQASRGGPERVNLAALLLEKGIITPAEAASVTKTGSNLRVPAFPPEVQAALADPKRRLGHYALVAELGRGQMGVVWRAHDLSANRPVAIKMILGACSPTRLKRFETEAAAARRLRHPAIVAAHEVGLHENRPYLVMDFVQGQSLESLMKSKLPPKWIAQLCRGIALALDEAHRGGVVHRDVKPENVIVDGEGQPHLTDFGLARDTTQEDQNLTQEGSPVGTPAYMAPELTGEHAEQGPGVDIYSLGAILYRALAGKPPFVANTFAGLVTKVLFEAPVPPSQIAPDVPPELEAITLRCLAKKSKDRFATAAELAAALERFVTSGDPEPAVVEEPTPDPEAEPAEAEPAKEPRARSRAARLTVSSSRHRRVRGGAESREERQSQDVTKLLMYIIPIGLLALAALALALR